MPRSTDLEPEVIGQLLALVAHDLRNPLAALQSNMGFLRSILTSPDDDVQDALTDGEISCEGLSHIIRNIDLLGQALRGAQPPERSRRALLPMVREVSTRCASVAASHDLAIEWDDSSLGEVEVFVERSLFTQALTNLIQNSIQHSPSRSTVCLRVVEASTEATVMVQDTGPALRPDQWEEVFTVDAQVAAKHNSDGRYSRGVGLYSARLAARASGSTVSVVSPQSGFSNAFALRVPLSV